MFCKYSSPHKQSWYITRMSSVFIKMSHWSLLDFHITCSLLPWQSIWSSTSSKMLGSFSTACIHSCFLLLFWIWSHSSKKPGLLTWRNLIKLLHITRPIFYLTGLHNKSFMMLGSEGVAQRGSVTKVVLKNFTKFTGKHLCQSLLFYKIGGLEACNFIKKETMAQVPSCEFCKIVWNTFCYRTPPVAASVGLW